MSNNRNNNYEACGPILTGLAALITAIAGIPLLKQCESNKSPEPTIIKQPSPERIIRRDHGTQTVPVPPGKNKPPPPPPTRY